MSEKKERQTPSCRSDYRHFLAIPTRWMDNDIYGHVNNVVYYAYFDTVINEYLIREGRLDIHKGDVVGFAVETGCRFYSSFSFPEVIEAGLAVARIGRSSVTYRVGLFAEGREQAGADGHFVHVFVKRSENQPVPIPENLRLAMEKLL